MSSAITWQERSKYVCVCFHLTISCYGNNHGIGINGNMCYKQLDPPERKSITVISIILQCTKLLKTKIYSICVVGCRKKILHEQVHSPCTNGDINTSDVTVTSSSSVDKKSKESSFTDPTSSSSSNDKKSSLKGSKLIALYDFEGTAFDDLTIVAGEYVYANLKDQIVPHWIWAYSPYRKRSGFIPEEYLKEPVITDI